MFRTDSLVSASVHPGDGWHDPLRGPMRRDYDPLLLFTASTQQRARNLVAAFA
jgi:hypothetical protein